jgi:hypothetical protein
MTKSIVTAILILAPATLAAAAPVVPGSYMEGSVGEAFVPNLASRSHTYALGPNTAVGPGEVAYENGVNLGVEAGGDFFAGSGFRWGVAYDQTKAKISSFVITGTINGFPGSVTLNPDVIEKSEIASGNIYYVLPTVFSRVQPYAGMGAGMAFVRGAKDTFAFSATIGARADINSWSYVGARYRFFGIGPTTDTTTGVRYESSTVHVVSGLIGIKF